MEELHAETYKAQEEELDKLQRELTGDGDIRTEQMLADLRSIHQSFKNDLANDSTTPSLRGELMSGELGLDIIYKIDQLFVESVRCLEDTIKLIKKSEEATETVKSVILEKRESVISEVKQTINQLAQTYAELITSTSDDDPSRLSQLRYVLDAYIEFDRTVDQNVRNLGGGDLFEQNEYYESNLPSYDRRIMDFLNNYSGPNIDVCSNLIGNLSNSLYEVGEIFLSTGTLTPSTNSLFVGSCVLVNKEINPSYTYPTKTVGLGIIRNNKYVFSHTGIEGECYPYAGGNKLRVSRIDSTNENYVYSLIINVISGEKSYEGQIPDWLDWWAGEYSPIIREQWPYFTHDYLALGTLYHLIASM